MILFVLGTLFLALSVAAVIITFAVDHAWFSDSFNTTNVVITNQNYTNQYGLWRLCFYPNQTCESWFQNEGSNSLYIDQRLNQSKGRRLICLLSDRCGILFSLLSSRNQRLASLGNSLSLSHRLDLHHCCCRVGLLCIVATCLLLPGHSRCVLRRPCR